ncbi:hypothetical protein [Porphyromonas gingivalis]|uniref:hypothetical protein n=1 Tax=Porphyromonas gingivalis TaxID=837 RepID=UPI000B4D4142|nr:hypothetical protein [Porphyromonas gingivalis]
MSKHLSNSESAFVSSKNTSPPTSASTPSKRSTLSMSGKKKENRALKAKLKDEKPGHKAYKLLS